MAFDTTAGSAILKYDYLPPIREELNNSLILMKRIERDKQSVVGKQAVVPLHTGRNEGVGARAEGGTLPTAQSQQYLDAYIGMAYNYGRIQISGQIIKAAQSDEGAFLRAVASETQRMMVDLKKSYNRQLYGDGTGTLGTVATTAASSTTIAVNPTRYLRPGMFVDLSTGAGAPYSTNNKITAVQKVAGSPVLVNQITLTSATAVTSGDAIVITGSYGQEILGLAAGIGTGNYLTTIVNNTSRNLGPAQGDTFWQSFLVNADPSGGTNLSQISEDLIQQAIDAPEQLAAGKISLLMTTHGIRRQYYRLLASSKRFPNKMALEGGFDALDYSGLPLVVDVDAPSNALWALDESSWKIYELSDFDWMDEDGTVLLRVANTDAYEARLFQYSNLCTDARDKNSEITNILE